eukprot:TRINITY_DN18070_c0_g3_i1.p1 TRINITY_DN18070_c0_g3~~TRINITY_DN18070_c0_g3_i1.p1  ORF type:complete len:293 (+),score=49.35 TRINITY_DN18070_c0_g3_i1:73-951(+)
MASAPAANFAGAATGSTTSRAVLSPNYYDYCTEVVPRLGVGGCAIGVFLATTTIPQVVRTSGGRVGQLNWSVWTRMFLRIWPKAGGLKAAQYAAIREMKTGLDTAGFHPAASKMLSFGVIGTLFQSVIYNELIKDVYKVYAGKVVERQSLAQVARSIAPGIVWCFGRETFSMGGGLYLGPILEARLKHEFTQRGIEVPEYPLSFASGFASGAATALATQWLHNTTLVAGRMAAANELKEAPHYTVSSLRVAYAEMGPGILTANYLQRIQLIAGAVALLNVVKIFHRPELRLL